MVTFYFKPTKSLKSKIKQLNTISQKLIDREKDKGGWEGKERHYKKGKNFENGANRLGNLINKNKNFSDLILLQKFFVQQKRSFKMILKLEGWI